MEKIIEKYLGIQDAKITKIDIGSQNETYIINDEHILKIFNKHTINSEFERKAWEAKEQVAEKVRLEGINVVLPYKFYGRYIQKENVYFSIYPYIKYKSISKEEILLGHVQELARIVSIMHGLSFDVTLKKEVRSKFSVDFDKYIIAHKDKENIASILINNKSMLENLQNRINLALNNLKGKEVISHNDLKLDNVLWDGFNAYLIDWDATGNINHVCAANEYAYFWSENKGVLNKEYYKEFMKIYMSNHKCIDNIYDVIYLTLYGKFSWLKYSLERSICKQAEEAKKGETAILELIQTFINYEKNIPEMVRIFNELNNKFND